MRDKIGLQRQQFFRRAKTIGHGTGRHAGGPAYEYIVLTVADHHRARGGGRQPGEYGLQSLGMGLEWKPGAAADDEVEKILQAELLQQGQREFLRFVGEHRFLFYAKIVEHFIHVRIKPRMLGEMAGIKLAKKFQRTG